MQGQKTLALSYNIHVLFLPDLLNDSQMISLTTHFSKLLLCVMPICDWSNWSYFHFIMPVMPDNAAFVIEVLLCVQRYRGNRYFYAPKAAPSGKEWICIFIQTNAKRPTSGWAMCLYFMLMSIWNGLGFILKTTQSRLCLLRDNGPHSWKSSRTNFCVNRS